MMALVSVLLHNDLRAANPVIVLRGILKTGLPYLRPCAVTAVSILLATLALEGLYRVSNFFLVLIAAWVFCAVSLYEAMVVVRILGMTYYHHAAKLGWFPERARWGAR